MSITKLPSDFKADSKAHLNDLHKALTQLNVSIPEKAFRSGKLDTTAAAVIKQFQKEYKLDATGHINADTIKAINTELYHRFISKNKYRTETLHVLLEKLNIPVNKTEKEKRTFGATTEHAIASLQKKAKLPVTGKVSEETLTYLHNQVIKERLKTKTQKGYLQELLLNVNGIAKLNIVIDPKEIKAKILGPTFIKLIKAFQEKYKLPVTGEVDKATLDKLTSVAASRGTNVALLNKQPAANLKVVNSVLRLNTVAPEVAVMQKSLSYLGYKIAEKEFKTQTFGDTTTTAIRSFQKSKGIAETGHYDKATARMINKAIVAANPTAETEHRYRIRGSVRNELWERVNNVVIKFFEKIVDKASDKPLGAKKVFLNGFFDIPYDAPINPVNGKIKDNFHLVVRLYTNADQVNPIAEQTHYNVNQIHWVNFTANKNEKGEIEYNGKYAGASDFEVTSGILDKAINYTGIENLKETSSNKQISQVSIQTGLSTDDIMCHVLSRLVQKSVNIPALKAEAFYAFIRQNLPAELPGDLLRGTSEWETIDQLTELAASGIVFLDPSTQQNALENAISQNLVPQTILINKDSILQELQKQRTNFTLTKPILVGNGNLQSLLKVSSINTAQYTTVAAVFINNKGVNTGFWDEIKTHESTIGAEAIADFTTTVEVSNISKNHLPTLTFLKSKIGNSHPFKAASDIAKADTSDLVTLIKQNGSQVPDNIPGTTTDERVNNYAASMKSRLEFLYPTVSLVATVKRSNTTALTKITDIENFIDTQKEMNFREQNLDAYLIDKKISLDPKVKEELKVVQRVQKLTTDTKAGSVLIDEGLHGSMQVYFTGKDRLTDLMKTKGVDLTKVSRLYESSKMQYMQVLARLTDYRGELYTHLPKAIIPHTYTKTEIKEALGDIPDLETLFGSMDYCDCSHCSSLYGPSAYLTDMLRFLKEHNSLVIQSGKTLTVKDILFDRRPDLGNIKLNCENTDTPLPYIDLVCEILENNISPQQKDFSFQTTFSPAELRAIPQYIRPYAYSTIAAADFPMNSSFNLWQEEARTYLNYLRVPRFELMEAFQDISTPATPVPADAAIASEFFSISSKEKDLIITTRLTAGDQNKYWGFDTTQTSVAVSEFSKHTKLSYYEVLELLLVKFVNGPDAPPVSKIERPVDSCDTDLQSVINLSLSKFDRMHRFIRLWRKSGWKMWELDLLIRNTKVGNNKIDADTLVNLKSFRQLQDKLKLPFEVLLAFFGEINREVRITPNKPDVLIQPLYNALFQNAAVTNPVDANFKALDVNNKPIDLVSSIILGINTVAPYVGYTPVPTILSALALRQPDIDLLIPKTTNQLTVTTLSVLLRYSYLARALKLSISDLLLLLGITNNTDPFSTLEKTLDTLKKYDAIKTSGLSLLELDYILNYKPDSPVGLRVESVALLIDSLRKILASNKEKIELLHLSDPDRSIILGVDTVALLTMTTPQLTTMLTTLNAVLSAAISSFAVAAFSVPETNYILQVNPATITPAGKITLANTIDTLQQNLVNLLNQNENQIKAQVATSFNLTDEQATILLTSIVVSPGPTPLLEKLEDEGLLATNSDGTYKEITIVNFPNQFNAYYLLHKISLLIVKIKIETLDLGWFILNNATAKTLNFDALPVSASISPNDFEGWYNLYALLSFKSKYPEPENASLRHIISIAKTAIAKSEFIPELALLTQWDEATINVLHDKLKLTIADYTTAVVYQRLMKCFEQINYTGATADTMISWAQITDDTTIDATVALQTRQTVKSKYEQEDWLQKITPLHDDIREKKRSALVEYHLENSQRTQPTTVLLNGKNIPNPLYWENSNALFNYFLIDVEMSSCQLTSRIKQALSSIQLFVQRCFLNLENRYVKVTQEEKEDTSSPNAWSQWKWMKNYRIWEANRKIFFYPENWLEPELRDDKSPFFEELESELMQKEITNENVEEAFQSYLHKMDEVAHLEVCGLYHQMEDLNPDEAGYETNVVHVIGRTKAIPNVYYYRYYDMNYSTWSAWEKIEVDITGDHAIPVVYNRKLHIFWLQFSEKAIKTKKIPAAEPSTGPTESPEPLKQLEIQLAWTIRKSSGWSAKKISKEKLIHPWERPYYSYNLKPFYLAKLNELYLDIYISTSQEFNDTKFYDPHVKSVKNPVYLTANRFNETYLPWHSSSFIFNGEIKDVKLKGLGGGFNIDLGFGSWGGWSDDDSYKYVYNNFGSDGRAIKELDPKLEYGPRLKLPNGMHYKNGRLTNNRFNSKNDSSLRVLENDATATLLNAASTPFELVITQQELQQNTIATDHPMFYQDNQRAFFIKPEWEARLNNYGEVISYNRKYRTTPFYHPYTLLFIRELNRSGIPGLLKRKVQTAPQSYPPYNTFNFSSYAPTPSTIVDATAQTDAVDFSFSGANAIYNWELFFHAPLMIACRLMQNQKFEDAMNWFHYIFNPTDIENYPTPQRYWITKPFFQYNSDDERKQRIDSILTNINSAANQEQLKAWRNHPFEPHVIARYRPVAYQKNVVMKYLDNLISWGDMLFKQDTLESINEASLLYMLAYEILGERPKQVPNVKHEDLSFNELESKLDAFGNARVDIIIEDTLLPITVVPTKTDAEPIPKLDTFYFCIPSNDYLTKYWDTVEDRLFKIRHCMNIEGIVRQLPLFEPPIDPALLVKAAAAGMDLSSVLNDLSAPTPYYRFRIIVQTAIDFCNDVKILGEKLLSALEKKDVETLSLLRSQQEIQLLKAVKEVRQKQIDEAVETIGSLNKAFELADEKKNYYEGRDMISTLEGLSIGLNSTSATITGVMAIGELIASQLHLIPSFSIGISGFGGSPEVTMSIGGSMFASSVQALDSSLGHVGGMLSQIASVINTIAGYERRKEEWDFLGRLANIEKSQIQFQINAAEIRQAIAEKELENQELQIENAETIDDYMRHKFTNDQLYNWMITQLSTVYFQAYQLAFDMAKKAEKCYQYELGLTTSNIIQFGYWDSLKKGLLSGDKLMTDLRKLEAEYIHQNRREFEITKHISLLQMAPASLITLKETGKCTISLPEWLFDMDYPGHYMRRIKNVSISIPCVVGPYTSINCTLSLLRNETRMNATLSGGNYEKQEDDIRFKTVFGAISSIATSNAQNDNGLFELNFNDERYLPFEGTGVISDWEINLPIGNNYFDFASLSDVIFHISYTSRNGGGQLTTKANESVQAILPVKAARLFSAKHEFGTEWYRFLNPEGGADQELVLNLKPEQYPFFIRGKLSTLKIKAVDVFIETDVEGSLSYTSALKVTSAAIINDLPIDRDLSFNNVHHLSKDFTAVGLPTALGEIRLKVKEKKVPEGDYKSLTSDRINNIFILIQLGI
jgi:peptidoglycan hydrolase-like protein with peptidoglycan-binding domain